MQILTVINDMLGTMGEVPLNAVDDPHPYKAACVSILQRVNREFQAKGWWFNRETLTLQPNGLNGHIYLPGSTISVRTPQATYVQRGNRLYNTAPDEGANPYVFTEEMEVTLLRLIPFEDTPELFAAHVAAEATLRFQKRYDGDSQKTRQLAEEAKAARIEANSEETRQGKVNLIESNERLTYIKSLVRDVRGRLY